MQKKIFFQSSMPRSGSTIFQNILGQNPDFYVTPTSGLLELFYGARLNYTNSLEFKAQDSELMKKAFLNFCNQGLYGYFDAITDKQYVMDKSRGWGVYMPFLESFYPNAKVICLVRDLRSVVSSYEKIFRKAPHKHDSMRDDSSARGTSVIKRVNEWLSATNTIGRSVERLAEIIMQNYDSKILFVKFEDLCLYPEDTMKKVYQYLDIPFYTHDFDNIEQITKEDDEVYGLTSDLHTIKPTLQLPKNDFKDILSKEISDSIYHNYKWYFDKFGYSK